MHSLSLSLCFAREKNKRRIAAVARGTLLKNDESRERFLASTFLLKCATPFFLSQKSSSGDLLLKFVFGLEFLHSPYYCIPWEKKSAYGEQGASLLLRTFSYRFCRPRCKGSSFFFFSFSFQMRLICGMCPRHKSINVHRDYAFHAASLL